MLGPGITLRPCLWVPATHPVAREQTPVPSLLPLPHLTCPLNVTKSVLFPAALPFPDPELPSFLTANPALL